jgi:hypothetical protein
MITIFSCCDPAPPQDYSGSGHRIYGDFHAHFDDYDTVVQDDDEDEEESRSGEGDTRDSHIAQEDEAEEQYENQSSREDNSGCDGDEETSCYSISFEDGRHTYWPSYYYTRYFCSLDERDAPSSEQEFIQIANTISSDWTFLLACFGTKSTCSTTPVIVRCSNTREVNRAIAIQTRLVADRLRDLFCPPSIGELVANVVVNIDVAVKLRPTEKGTCFLTSSKKAKEFIRHVMAIDPEEARNASQALVVEAMRPNREFRASIVILQDYHPELTGRRTVTGQ